MGQILYTLLISPIEYFIETVFTTMNLLFRHPGMAIIFVSVAVQLLCFPLYKRADDIQEQERLKQKEMEHWVTHIKNTFKGDERFMMQQAYYREAGYKPIYAIKGSISLLLQIPFFIAAYNFLSGLDTLKGVSFIGIPDLSAPDGMIHIGTLSVNLLPILMTFFNIISGVIYTKGFPLKDKIQTYGLAAIFLVILYQSPSGLVFYWTLNNFFSLFKNVILKLVKNTKRFICIVLAVVGAAFPIYLQTIENRSLKLSAAMYALTALCIIPLILYIISSVRKAPMLPKFNKEIFKNVDIKLVNTVFYVSSAVVLLLLGLLVPIDVIKTSPVEFQSTNYGPFGLILNTFSLFAGLIFIWITIFYVFSSPKIRKIFSLVASIFAVTGVVNYLFFSKDHGTMSTTFVFDDKPVFRMSEIAINFAVVVVIAAVIIIAYGKKAELVKRLSQILCLALSIMIVIGSFSIKKTFDFEMQSVEEAGTETPGDTKMINLTKNGKNVIVFMIDRAISGYLPFIMEEKPELKEMFDGFTYYPNTVSFGGYTNYGTPALFGGYEYTVSEMNSRENESLKKKHNEAITMLPKLFADNGYKVSVIDPPYAGYKWVSDLSLYDGLEGVNAYCATGKYSQESIEKYTHLFEPTQKRNAVVYGIMKAAPVFAQERIYGTGNYWGAEPFTEPVEAFFNEYTVLQNLSKLTSISGTSENTFTMMQNSTTHEPMLFDDDYDMPSQKSVVQPLPERESDDGTVMQLSRKNQISHYRTNIAALLRIGEWLEYLKAQGVYDNTRIILVADHGRDLGQFNKTDVVDGIDIQMYNPLLMVKDFNSKGFTTSDEFMTNADTPTLAVSGVISNPVNPFTGKVIDNSEKTAHAQVITTAENFKVAPDMGNKFDTSGGEWWSVEKNIFDAQNWKKVGSDK